MVQVPYREGGVYPGPDEHGCEQLEVALRASRYTTRLSTCSPRFAWGWLALSLDCGFRVLHGWSWCFDKPP